MAELKDPISERARLAVIRLMGEMQQKELARRAGQIYRDVHKFVNGQGFPQPTLMHECLVALGSGLDEIIRKKGEIRPRRLPLSSEERAVLEAYRQVREDLQPTVVVWLAGLRRGQVDPGKGRVLRRTSGPAAAKTG